MVKHMFSNLLLLWSLICDIQTSGPTQDDPEEQSWNGRSLNSVPQDLDVRLRRLDLSNNFIRQLHTLVLPHLEQLDLSSNQLDLISGGALEDLARLEDLNLSRNALNNNLGSNSKALQSTRGLRSLDLSRNGLSEDMAALYLRNKPSLVHLKMSGNSLTRLSHSLFEESQGLRAITIDDNMISVIDRGTFEPLAELEILDLAKNSLARICDFKLQQLKHLNLSRNSVEFFVTREDHSAYQLEVLDLSFNKLLYFPIVPKLNRLKYLYLQNNMVGALKSEAVMVSEVNSLYSEITSEKIVTKNNLHSIWRQMPLIYLDLSYNHFSFLPLETLSLLSSLETLNFSYNCLQNITWNIRNYSDSSGNHRQLFFSSLKHLDLQNNGLMYASPHFVGALTQIDTLNLRGNALRPCALPDHLERPELAQEYIDPSCVALKRLETLKHLSLEENQIQSLYPKTFQETSLVSLNLAGNPHMVVHQGALDHVQTTLRTLTISKGNMSNSELSLPRLPALTHLNLSDNLLSLLPDRLTCSPLTELDIRNNRFVSLNYSQIQALSVHLNIMYVSGNRFDCCDSGWLRILNETNLNLADIDDTYCFSGDTRVKLTEYLKRSSTYCVFPGKTQEVHVTQMFVIAAFVFILITVFVVFTRKLCCAPRSFFV